MVEKQLDRIKTHLGRNPKVCSVCTITCSQPQPHARRSPQRDVTRGHGGTACVTLVNTSVYLKPTKLLNVAFDVLA